MFPREILLTSTTNGNKIRVGLESGAVRKTMRSGRLLRNLDFD
jgi:hypothetical protein